MDPAGPGPEDLHIVAESWAEREAWLQQLAAAAEIPVSRVGPTGGGEPGTGPQGT